MFSSISLQLAANNIVNASNYRDFTTHWCLALWAECLNHGVLILGDNASLQASSILSLCA